jgi:hypothetical protein
MNHDFSTLGTDFLRCLREREVQRDDPAAVERFQRAYRQLTESTRQANRADQDRLLQILVAGMSQTLSNWEFGCLANTCGEIVEWGGDPACALAPILDRITEQLARVPELVRIMQDHLGVEHPNHVAEQDWRQLGTEHPDHAWVIGEWYALQFTGCAAMTMLSRDVPQRQRARERVELLQRAEAARSDNPYAYYLAELLGTIDDVCLLVLDTTRRLGFRVRLTAIRNNFHLFTLLQDALLAHPTASEWRGPRLRVRPLVVAVARSERMLPDISPNEWTAEDPQNVKNVQDSAIWTYYTWPALKADGTLWKFNEKKEKLPDWVWGEMKPTHIPLFEAERIVLLGPREFPRSWDIAFFAPLHPALRSSVVVEQVLGESEFYAWIRKIQVA